jgi:alpha-tubulin suppressor-like RCC1 family protein
VGDRSRPCKLEGIEFKKAVEVAAGGQYSMAVSYHDVAAYVWGDASGGCHGALGMACPSVGIVSGVSRPVKMRGFPDGVRVTNVSCGAFHAAAVTAGGDLFTWGEGAFHALGHDGDKSTSPTPKRVRGLVDAGRRVCAVSCGVYHTAAVAKDAAMGPGTGELWTWGDADGGKLGHGLDAGKHPVHSPQRVHGFDADADVTSVSCGQWHTLSILADYSLWVCGSVGRVAPTDPALVPTRVDIPGSGGVEAVASGEWHAAAIGRGRGAIYTWGRGRRGALGHAGGRDEHSPRALGGTLAGGRTVHSVACGPESTAAIVSSKSMTVAERAGLTKKKDLALNFTGKPTKS